MMMTSIEQDFREKVCAQTRLASEGMQRFRVFTPFLFHDGDHLSIVLKNEQGRWVLSDEGHTFMHLTYDLDEKELQRGTRQRIITNALSLYQVEDRGGELLLPIESDQYGDALFSFVQALLKITDVLFLSRDRVFSTFMEDFQQFMSETVPSDRATFDWHDSRHDPKGNYKVDCRINGMAQPLFIFALANDDRTRDATITLHQFENWGVPFHSMAIFEEQETINRKVLARFSDICGKQFSNLGANRDRIAKHVQQMLH
ncbi:MAG: DUF1828 domain-containing protein [Magnetococcales bacterium]|nr:DUF1828 domain-containing protein [Magnetococcales bacterium]